MPSPLPDNIKHGWAQENTDASAEPPSSHHPSSQESGDPSLDSTSHDRNRATARLASLLIPPNATSGYESPPPSAAVDSECNTTGQDGARGNLVDLRRCSTNHSSTGGSPSLFRPLSTPTYNYDDNTVSADLSEDLIAKLVKRHLAAGTSSPPGSPRSDSLSKKDSLSRIHTNSSSFSSYPTVRYNAEGDNEDPMTTSVHQLPGGAITYDVYKWTDDQEMEQCKRQRSQSVHLPRPSLVGPALARLKDPGGFRRHFVVDKAARQGKEPPYWMTRTFVDFLALYGHFGGEDLSDDDDDDDDGDDGGEAALLEDGFMTGLRHRRYGGTDDDETLPLIRRAQENAVRGTATPSKAVFLLLKSFVGTGKSGD